MYQFTTLMALLSSNLSSGSVHQVDKKSQIGHKILMTLIRRQMLIGIAGEQTHKFTIKAVLEAMVRELESISSTNAFRVAQTLPSSMQQ